MNDELGLGTPSAQPRFSKKKHKKNKVFKTTALVTVLLAGLVLAFLFLTPVFHIREITVTGTEYLSPERVLDASDLDVGTNILTFRTSDTESKIASLSFVKTVNVTRQYPNQVSIVITECKPIAEILCGESLYLIVDETGKILDTSSDMGKYQVPVIEGIIVEQFEVGKVVSADNPEAVTTLLAIAQELSKNEMAIPVNRLSIQNGDIFLHFENNISADIGSGNDAAYKIKFLTEAVQSIPEGKTGIIEFIDEGKAVLKEYE
ncbi:MAG: FtsQ-type POTRA domain-containing protein [Clostridia bacterium]|nr:FtsQ-type POTRA domain-containing protein [Clostridia bacterium]